MRIVSLSEGWVTGQFQAFDTVNELTVPQAFQEILAPCVQLCARFHRLFSPSLPDSDICRLNRSEGTVEVDPETAQLLRLALELGRKTGGLFDITIAPAVHLWSWKTRKVPISPQELEAASARRGLEQIAVSDHTVSLPHSVEVDVGGIAKGYIADRLLALLQDHSVPSALINLGGNISLLHGRDGADWRVGIRRPDGGRKDYDVIFVGRDRSLSTSAASERYCEIHGTRYHHLLDPESGWPAQTDIVSATVIAPSSVYSDALSTACFVGGLGQSKTLLRQFSAQGAEAVLLDRSGALHLTRGLWGSGKVIDLRPEAPPPHLI